MSDDRGERLKNQTQDSAQKKREEYDWLMHLLKERVEEWNASRGDLPEIVMTGSSLQLDRYKLYLEFDQLWPQPTNYVLVLKVGLGQNSLFWSEPPAVRHKMQPTASDDRGSIVWTHTLDNVAPFTTEELAEFALDMLTGYYSRHKPK
jgi:hypothetical protein